MVILVKGLFQADFALLGHFRPDVITLCLCPYTKCRRGGGGEGGIEVKLEKVDCDETCHRSESLPTITQSIDKLKKTRI